MESYPSSLSSWCSKYPLQLSGNAVTAIAFFKSAMLPRSVVYRLVTSATASPSGCFESSSRVTSSF
ncbi:MAG: hypothetical protein IH921_10575 [Gemmatimonadetes bacterium]|nr:hypothetical protein [Gemmatimonadota bacterium]